MAVLTRKRIFEIHEQVVELCNTSSQDHEGFPVEFAKAIAAETLTVAAKACSGESCQAAGDNYQTAQGEYWDAGSVYGQARFDCEQLLTAMIKQPVEVPNTAT